MSPWVRQAATAHMQFQFQIIDGSPVFFQDGATHLLVMKFVLSSTANSDVISIYLDPTSVTEPDLPNLAITGTNVQLAALGMGPNRKPNVKHVPLRSVA